MTLKEVLQHNWLTNEIRDIGKARSNSLPGDVFELYSSINPEIKKEGKGSK